jgi:hypothetical protein
MGTSNFARGNTSKVFAVLMNREETYKECSECGERHYDYDYSEESFKNLTCCEGATFEEETDYVSPEEYEYDDLKDYICETAQEEIKDLKEVWYREESGSDNDRNYCATNLFSFNTSKMFGDIEVEVRVIGQIVGAYYEGASLDFRLEIYNGGEWSEVSNGYYAITERDILDDLFAPKYDHYNSDMNQGMRKIQMTNATKWAEKKATELKELIEEVFTKVSMPLNVVGTFSSGETIYSKA